MANQISILGLGQIGSSIGLALEDKTDKLFRVGHDRDITFANQSKKMNAIDKIAINIHGAVKDADIIVMALPYDQIRETFEMITEDLKEDVVFLDTCPIREKPALWAKEILPTHVHYLGFTPILNSEYLHQFQSGVSGAQKDLFQTGRFAISAGPNLPGEAISLAGNLADYMGATLTFVDQNELDGIMATIHTAPQLVAAAMASVPFNQSGWRDMRSFTGKPFTQVSTPLLNMDSSESIAKSAVDNKENLTRILNEVIEQLQAIREAVQEGDDGSLSSFLNGLVSEWEFWWEGRILYDWDTRMTPDEVSNYSGILDRTFGFLRGSRKEKK
ncbi:MAG: prephenate dehydrogenase/arogenate dehydrogenase family protein [Anaerolineales bacterium]|nr:prephenate dehydrogenase/arogenate dehydrogenase family protein [Anaerolineales bacterium]